MGEEEKSRYRSHTIASLRLDLEATKDGRIWNLLPEPFRLPEAARHYPLPSHFNELDHIIKTVIPPPPGGRGVVDPGKIYYDRVYKKWKDRAKYRVSAAINIGGQEERIKAKAAVVTSRMENYQQDARQILGKFREEARAAIATLNDLFSLGREGLEGQMRAHLSGEEWKGEAISASAFRECFRMVTQAVKGLGMPSDQARPARDAIMEQAAASMRATQEAVAMAPSAKEETEH